MSDCPCSVFNVIDILAHFHCILRPVTVSVVPPYSTANNTIPRCGPKFRKPWKIVVAIYVSHKLSKPRHLRLQPEWEKSTNNAVYHGRPVPRNRRDLTSDWFWATWCVESASDASTKYGTNHGQWITNCNREQAGGGVA